MGDGLVPEGVVLSGSFSTRPGLVAISGSLNLPGLPVHLKAHCPIHK